MRHYSLTDQLYHSDMKNYVVSATEASQALDLVPASKKLFLRNDGANDVYIAFDKSEASTDDFKLTTDDGLIEIDVQCEQLAFVCAAGQTATVRIGSNY